MTIKTYTIDITSYTEVTDLIYKLQTIKKKIALENGYTAITFNNSSRNMADIFPLFEEILNTDLSEVYNTSSGSSDFYTYVHCDPTKPLSVKHNIKHAVLASKFGLSHEPFYVGKGTGTRCFDLSRNDSHRKVRSVIRKLGNEVQVVKIADFISEAKSLELEAKIIDILGLKSLCQYGLLVNLDEGAHVVQRRLKYPAKCLDILISNNFHGAKLLRQTITIHR